MVVISFLVTANKGSGRDTKGCSRLDGVTCLAGTASCPHLFISPPCHPCHHVSRTGAQPLLDHVGLEQKDTGQSSTSGHLSFPKAPSRSFAPLCHGPSAQRISCVSSFSSALPPAVFDAIPAALRLSGHGGGRPASLALPFQQSPNLPRFPSHLSTLLLLGATNK